MLEQVADLRSKLRAQAQEIFIFLTNPMPRKLLMLTVHKQAFNAWPAKWRQCLMCWPFPHVLPTVDSCMLYFIAFFFYSACIAIDHQYCLATASKAVFTVNTLVEPSCGLVSNVLNRIPPLYVIAKQLQFQMHCTVCHWQLHWQKGGLQFYQTAKWNV